MSFFGVIGLAGLYARQATKAGWLGLAGFVALSAWMVLIMGFSFVEAFVLPRVATSSPGFVQGWMGMLNGDGSPVKLGALPAVWLLTVTAVHRRRAAVRDRDVPRTHLASWRRCASGRWNRVGAGGKSALADLAAEDRYPDWARLGLAGIRADD